MVMVQNPKVNVGDQAPGCVYVKLALIFLFTRALEVVFISFGRPPKGLQRDVYKTFSLYLCPRNLNQKRRDASSRASLFQESLPIFLGECAE